MTTKKITDGDSRINRTANAPQARASRSSADADRVIKDGNTLTAEERRRLLREEAVQEILPKLPEIPGYHVCWLTTTNATDSLFKRYRLGYSLIRASEVPGYEQWEAKGGEYDGVIACNEMLAAKIPYQTYIDLMTIYHHDIPNEEEASIREKLKSKVMADTKGNNVEFIEEGEFAELGAPRTPSFS